jgi:SAM-dependent methyltransferase
VEKSESTDEDLAGRLAKLEARHEALSGLLQPAFWTLLDRFYTRLGPERPPRCLACDASGPFSLRYDQCVFGGGALERLECPDCGCVFGPLKYLELPLQLIEADYKLLYQSYTEADSTEQELRAFRALDPKPGGLYLNWGSGAWSASVERLRAEGFDVWGYEPYAQTSGPYLVKSRGEISAKFDGIFSNNVIEHLIDPASQFRDFACLLKPKGRMAHASPCYDWRYAFTRFHVFFPMGEAPENLAARTGYRVVGRENDGDYRVRVFESL